MQHVDVCSINKEKESKPEKVNLIVQKEHNTTILTKYCQNILTPEDQFRSRIEHRGVDEESEGEKVRRGTNESNNKTE